MDIGDTMSITYSKEQDHRLISRLPLGLPFQVLLHSKHNPPLQVVSSPEPAVYDSTESPIPFPDVSISSPNHSNPLTTPISSPTATPNSTPTSTPSPSPPPPAPPATPPLALLDVPPVR
ncbi:hypothetical protein BDQ17DRAFT_1436561 [Cyathus striatus]|nr:hypothetical protein BDQ17DRAFT_1436561 [Cyathus striatus]